MKKKINLLLLVVMILSFTCNSVFAASIFTMYGQTDSDASYATVLVLDKGTDIKAIKPENIRYVNQTDVDADGSFAITFPLLAEDFDVYSNMTDFDFSSEGIQKKTVYVSGVSGNDSYSGEQNTPFKTLEKAYKNILFINEIVLLDDATYSEAPIHTGNLTIRGASADVVLNMPEKVSLQGDLTIDNVVTKGKSTIFANGYKLVMGSGVTTDAPKLENRKNEERLTVYGGKNGSAITGDTDIQLLGGKYMNVYGGGYNGAVNGNTNIVLGGNMNAGDGIDDDTANFSPCRVFGGGNSGAVSGSTNITVQDNAVIGYIGGAGSGASGSAKETNININGGAVMNVYGGSLNAELSGIVTNINMRGGVVEALFGGSQGKGMTGHTNVNVYGGEVTRRIFTGCYNESKIISWSSDYYLNGTTFLGLHTANKMITGTEYDYGIFAGSRRSSNHADEHNTLAFLDGCYSSAKGLIAKAAVCNSHQDYTVIATAGGNIESTQTAGGIKLVPDNGYDAKIGGEIKETYTVSANNLNSPLKVDFVKRDFYINSVDAQKGENSVSGNADITADNSANETEPKLFIAVYDADTMQMLACDMQNAVTGKTDFSISYQFETGKKYLIKAMMWNGALKPLTSSYCIELK